MPEISIIVPVYKVEKYLRQCVESILNQTFRDFELILVDDGSPDRCGEICDEYASSDSRVKVIHQSNGGQSAARNAGLDVAVGKYLGFVDGDDFIHEEMFETLYNAAENSKVDLVVCNFERTSEEGAPETNSSMDEYRLKDGFYSNKVALKGLVSHDVFMWVMLWNKLYNRNLFSDVRFPLGKVCEDCARIHEIFVKNEVFYFINRTLYYYRRNQASSVNNKNINYRLCYGEALISRLNFYEKKNMIEEIEESIERLMFFYFADFYRYLKFENPMQKKRYRKLKKDVRYFYYKYGGSIRLMEKFNFEAPKIFSLLRKIKRYIKRDHK